MKSVELELEIQEAATDGAHLHFYIVFEGVSDSDAISKTAGFRNVKNACENTYHVVPTGTSFRIVDNIKRSYGTLKTTENGVVGQLSNLNGDFTEIEWKFPRGTK